MHRIPAAQTAFNPADGSLSIDLAPHAQVRLRLSSWSDGLALEAREPYGWNATPYDPDLPLLSAFDDYEAEHPMRCFLERVPAEDRARLARFRSFELTGMRLLRHFPAARDLIDGTPNLFWLLAAALGNRGMTHTGGRALLGKKRLLILSWALGRPVPRAALKLLAKYRPSRFDGTELGFLRAVLVRDQAVTAFRHFPEVALEDLVLVSRHSRLAEYGFFADLVARARDDPRLAQTVLELLADVALLARALDIERHDVVVRRCRSLAELQRLHDRWTDRANAQLARERERRRVLDAGALHRGADRARPPPTERPLRVDFPDPPVPGSETIEPIRSTHELVQEGIAMHHCVAVYAPRVRDGASYIYRVLRPERATLELRPSSRGWRVYQLKLAFNRAPSVATRAEVSMWLDDWKREQRRARHARKPRPAKS